MMLTVGIKKGFTLVELLVVFSIIAVIGGMGLAVWSHSGKQVGFQAQRGEIASMIQLAQSTARIEKRSVSITVDPAVKEVYYIAKRVFGLWHFEDYSSETNSTTGALNLANQFNGSVSIVRDGYVGGGLFLEYRADSSSWCQIDRIPLLNRADGLMVEVAIYPMVITPSDRTILEKSGEFNLMLAAGDFISLSFGQSTISTTWNSIPYDRWSVLKFMFEPDVYGTAQSNGKLSLYVNNQLMEEISGIAKADGGDAPIIIGSKENGVSFFGIVDELKFSGLAKSEAIKLDPVDTTVDVVMPDGRSAALTQPLTLIINKDGTLTGGAVKLRFTSNGVHDSFEVAVR